MDRPLSELPFNLEFEPKEIPLQDLKKMIEELNFEEEDTPSGGDGNTSCFSPSGVITGLMLLAVTVVSSLCVR